MVAGSIPTGRLAPSPTGYAHLGNAWAFLLAWLAIRSIGGRLILRLEDIDPQRSRPEYASSLLEDLRWLGLDWDEGPDKGGARGPYVQSAREAIYDDALKKLDMAGLVYPCYCTRKELRQLAAAPHIDDIGAPYPGTCRTLDAVQRTTLAKSGRKPTLRLHCPEDILTFTDLSLGLQCFTLTDCGGDFALRRSDGVWAYQLVVAIDDALMGVTQVVRGRDILSSTPRQIAILQILGHQVPTYGHIPLLLNEQGERLAKRHQSLTLRYLHDQGVEAQRIIGLLGYLAGLVSSEKPISPSELISHFSWKYLPKTDRVVSEQALSRLLR